MITASSVGCKRCPLSCSRRSIVDGAGPLDSLLMVVGEYPHREEDRASSPFVGASGRLTRSAIAAICQRLGVDASKVFYTYVARCKPKDGAVPTDAEYEHCQSWLAEELDTVQPKAVLALGQNAHWQVSELAFGMTPQPYVMNTYAPFYIIKNKGKLGHWLSRLEVAIRAAFDLPALQTIAIDGVEAWSIGQPDMSSPWLSADTEFDTLEEGEHGSIPVGYSMSDGSVSGFWTDGFKQPWPHLYLHNIRADADHLGIDLDDLDSWDDTMLMAYMTRQFRLVGLKELGPKLGGVPWPTTIKELLREYVPSGAVFKSGPRKGMEKPGKWIAVPFSRALATRRQECETYASIDALDTARVAKHLESLLDADDGWARRYYLEFDKPLVPVLHQMERTGIRVDPDALRAAESVIMANRRDTEERLQAALGADVALGGDEAGPLLYELGVVDGKRTETGKIGTAKPNVLAAFGVEKAEEIPFDTDAGKLARDYLDWKFMGKLKSTYVDGILGRPKDGTKKAMPYRLDSEGRYHTRFSQTSANTNRLSSGIHTIPAPGKKLTTKGEDLGKALRSSFIPADGNVFVGGDFSQLQLRLFGELTHEPTFINAYAGDGADFHQYAADVLGRPRNVVKNFVFAVLFGADAPKAAATAGVPEEQASGFIAQLRDQIPSLVTWQDLTAQQLTTLGYVESLMGWRGYFPDYAGMVNQWSSAALREAANFRVQATEAGLVKGFMIELYRLLKREYPEWRMVLQVHDECWAEGPADQAAEVEALMPELAASVAKRWIRAVPIRFDTKTVASWGAAK